MNTSQRQQCVELPEIDTGLTLVDVDSDLGVTPVESLLLDCVFAGDGDAYWVDVAGAARTTRLRELAPDRRYLHRVHVARGFTAYQQTSLLDRLTGEHVTAQSVVVATGIDRLYREDDVPTNRAQELLVRSIDVISIFDESLILREIAAANRSLKNQLCCCQAMNTLDIGDQ